MGSSPSPSHKTSAAIIALCAMYVFFLGAQVLHAQTSTTGSSSILRPTTRMNATSTATLQEVKNRLEQQRKAAIKNNSTSTTQRESDGRFEQKVGSTTKPVDARIASGTRPALSSAIHRGVETSITMAINRLTAAADRLINISGRIKTRIDKVSQEGARMTAAKALLATANQKILDAKAKIALISKPVLPSDPSADGTRDAYKKAFEATRTQVKAADKAIQDAKSALEAVLKEIKKKEAKNSVEVHASTTSN